MPESKPEHPFARPWDEWSTRKRLLVSVLFLLLVPVAWYLFSRVEAMGQRVRVVVLNPASSMRQGAGTLESAHQLSIACYNIAHGRGGELGTDNWDGGTREERLGRLHRIADQIRNAGSEVVVYSGRRFRRHMIGRIAGFAERAGELELAGGQAVVQVTRRLFHLIPGSLLHITIGRDIRHPFHNIDHLGNDVDLHIMGDFGTFTVVRMAVSVVMAMTLVRLLGQVIVGMSPGTRPVDGLHHAKGFGGG